MARKYLDSIGLGHLWDLIKGLFGKPEAPYQEVEWVESNGKQYVYTDWHPPIATWGFEADFIIRNTFNTTQAAWNPDTNANNAGALFGVRNAGGVNDIQLTTYSTNGYFRIGDSATIASGIKKDGTRQQISLKGTTLTKPDGTTATVTRATETANKPYQNMTVFAYHDGLRRTGSGAVVYPSSTRIYSLKFYDGETLAVDLVGAIRKKDGVTGLYDKVSHHFYPAAGMTYGGVVGDIGDVDTLLNSVHKNSIYLRADNTVATRMWRVNAPTLNRLEDGQIITIVPRYATSASYQTTELSNWDDTGNNSYVYIKLTLTNGIVTDWIPVYLSSTTRLTTHYGAGEPITMTYSENVLFNATATTGGNGIMRGFFCTDYNTDNAYDRYSGSVIVGKNGVKRYSICMKDDAGNWTSIVNEANKTGLADKTCYTGGLKLSKILYHSSGSDFAAGGNTGDMWQTYVCDLRYSLNGISSAAASTTLQLRKPVYLVGTIGNDGLFYLDTTKWWAQDEPTTADGKVYVLLGSAYGSYYQSYLAAHNPVYAYKNGRFQEIYNGHSLEADVPPNASFTDTTYSAGTGLSLSGTTFSNSGVISIKGSNETDYRTGNINLTPHQIGAAYGVNEVLNPFAPEKSYRIQIDRLENAFYFADKRWNVTAVKINSDNTTTNISANGISYLFDMCETDTRNVPANGSLVVTIDFSNETNGVFPNYPYGYVYLGFYYTKIPLSVSARVYGKHTGSEFYWRNLNVRADNRNTNGSCRYIIDQTVMYNMQKLEITVNGGDADASLQEISYYMTRAGKNKDMPYLSKLREEKLYYNLTAPKFIGNVEGNVTGNCSGTVNGHTVNKDVPSNAVFTDTTTTVSYDSTNNKITQTINGTTTDVVTIAQIKNALGLTIDIDGTVHL